MKKVFTLFVLFVSLFITSCASTIVTTVQRPAELDLHGAKSISVLPFQTSYYNDESSISILGLLKIVLNGDRNENKKRIADYLTNELTEELLNSGFMEVIGPRRVENALNKGDQPPCDVYLSGYITDYEEDIDEHWDEDEEAYYYTKYVEFKIVYEIIDSETDHVISRKSQNFSKTSAKEWHRRDLDSPYNMVRSDLDSLVNKIMKQLQPYEVTKYLYIIDDKTKMEEMKRAKTLAKDGYLEMSQQMYESIYKDTGIYEAGYNAAIIMEARGYLYEAEELMEKVYFASAERKAYTALNDIRSEIQSAEKLQNQLDKKESR